MVTERKGAAGLDERLASSLTDGAFLSSEDVERALAKSKVTKQCLAEVLLGDQMKV